MSDESDSFDDEACNIGKLPRSRLVLRQLSRDKKSKILTTEPASDSSSDPSTRLNEKFIANFVMVFFVVRVHCLLLVLLADTIPGSL